MIVFISELEGAQQSTAAELLCSSDSLVDCDIAMEIEHIFWVHLCLRAIAGEETVESWGRMDTRT